MNLRRLLFVVYLGGLHVLALSSLLIFLLIWLRPTEFVGEEVADLTQAVARKYLCESSNINEPVVINGVLGQFDQSTCVSSQAARWRVASSEARKPDELVTVGHGAHMKPEVERPDNLSFEFQKMPLYGVAVVSIRRADRFQVAFVIRSINEWVAL